jgi:hypothetical protein
MTEDVMAKLRQLKRHGCHGTSGQDARFLMEKSM